MLMCASLMCLFIFVCIFRTRTKNMWVLRHCQTRSIASPSRRDLTSRSWWQVNPRLHICRHLILSPTFDFEETANHRVLTSLFCPCCSLFEGESGLGKSTLVNSLFLTDLYKDRKLLNAEGEEAAAFDMYFLIFCFVR